MEMYCCTSSSVVPRRPSRLRECTLVALVSVVCPTLAGIQKLITNGIRHCAPNSIDRRITHQDQESLLVKHRDDNHSPEAVIREISP